MFEQTLSSKIVQGHTGVKLLDAFDELTLEVPAQHLLSVMQALKTEQNLQFDILIDVCGVDYSAFGQTEWETDAATAEGFSRGREQGVVEGVKLAVVYHLLSTVLNHRIRVRVYCDETDPVVPSVCALWPVADWYEREAYDLFGVLFEGHQDLRRILTDYGFVGHPFQKSFPISGHVEVRYDAENRRCVYEPVSIPERTLVPRVIRHDNRYLGEEDNR